MRFFRDHTWIVTHPDVIERFLARADWTVWVCSHRKLAQRFFLIPDSYSHSQTTSSRGTEETMPYGSGESPKTGDYVKNKREQPGTVTAVVAAQAGHELVSIRWDDGGADPPLKSADEFTLVSRKSS